jgi:dephospho-CoA kinase
MLIAGLTGGMACGKSFVANALRELGCYIIEADEIGREVMKPGGEAYDAIVEAFGDSVIDENGSIDRIAMAARVFNSPADLFRLNSIVHPAVRERSKRETREIGSRDPHAVVIHVAAILIESGASRDVDKVIVVTCTPEQQLERALSRSGASRTDVLARLKSQMPLDKKKSFADYVIDASGTEADTLRQTRLVWENLKRLA